MSNKEKFKETFGQIEISNEVLDEIEGFQLKSKRRNYVKPIVVVAVMCALVLLMGKFVWNFTEGKSNNELANGKIYYYAAEREEEKSIIYQIPKNEVVLKNEHMLVNNDKLSEDVIAFYTDDEGFYCYEMKDGNAWRMKVEKPEHTSILGYRYKNDRGGTSSGILGFDGELKEKDGRIYLCFDSTEKGRDITESFQDGTASGRIYWETEDIYDRIKATLEFQVSGTLENYTVDIWLVDEE